MLMTRKLCTSQPLHKVSGTGLISRVTISGEITIMHLSITRYPHFYFYFEKCLKGKMEILIMITYECIAFWWMMVFNSFNSFISFWMWPWAEDFSVTAPNTTPPNPGTGAPLTPWGTSGNTEGTGCPRGTAMTSPCWLTMLKWFSTKKIVFQLLSLWFQTPWVHVNLCVPKGLLHGSLTRSSI